MSTNTYRLAVALQAKAIDSIDLHAGGVYTAAHSFGENITVVARYRTGADQRILQIWAHDADAHLLGSAEASTPLGSGVIASHVTAFRGDHLRWERRTIPTTEQYRNPAALAIGTHPSQAQIGFHSCGRADYYLSHDWAPGRSPRDTTAFAPLPGTAFVGLGLQCRHPLVEPVIDRIRALACRQENRQIVHVRAGAAGQIGLRGYHGLARCPPCRLRRCTICHGHTLSPSNPLMPHPNSTTFHHHRPHPAPPCRTTSSRRSVSSS